MKPDVTINEVSMLSLGQYDHGAGKEFSYSIY